MRNSTISVTNVSDFTVEYHIDNSSLDIIIIRSKADPNFLFGDIYRGSGWVASFAITGGEIFLVDAIWWKDRRRQFTLSVPETEVIDVIKTGEVRSGLNRQEAQELHFEAGFGDCDAITHLEKIAIAWKRYKRSPKIDITKEARYL